MIRSQIQLTPEQASALRRAAARRGVSTASLVREAVDRLLATGDAPTASAKAKAAIGAFASGGGDAAREHDRHLDAVYGA